jgi:hypothetical protein
MNCDTALGMVEALAAGDIELTTELRAHLDICPGCTAELQIARGIHESLLSGRATAPRHFTGRVLHRLPAPASQSESPVWMDVWFDSAMAMSLVLVITGVWFLADPALLRQALDSIGAAFSGGSRLMLRAVTTPTGRVAVATVIVVTAVVTLNVLDEA